MACLRMPLLIGLMLALTTAGLPIRAEDAGAEAAPGTLVEVQEVKFTSVREWNDQFQHKLVTDLQARGDAFQTFGPLTVFRQMLQGYVSELVPSMGLRYASEDASQRPRTYSGRLFLPSRKAGSAPTRVPLVLYQHGTETRRTYTPYFNQGDETMLGALGAEAGGFAVAMPDGDGMGADPSQEPHAYCHEATTARCLLDLARAIETSGTRIFDGLNYVWDGRLYLLGYSEGGYITLAAVKALSTDPAWKDLKVTGAACMGGPFDLAKMVRTLLQGGETYTRPYIPTYLLSTWPSLYPGLFRFEDAVNPALLGTSPAHRGGPDEGSIKQWMDGRLGGDQITPRIQARLTGDSKGAVSARSVLKEAWAKANVDNEGSGVMQALEENGLVGDWLPRFPVLLAHDPHDECVGSYNSRSLFDAWSRQGYHPMGVVPLEAGGHGAGHVGGALLSVPMAFVWFRAGMPSSLMSLAAGALKAQVLSNLDPGLAAVVDRATTLAVQEQNSNRAEFPLSRVHLEPGEKARPWSVRLADAFWSLGKVKLYTLTAFPQFMGQAAVPGLGGYTKFIKQLKQRGDSCEFKPGEDVYLAVYPENGAVALTLGFSGYSGGAPQDWKLNIKQVKNKVLQGSGAAFDGPDAFLERHVHNGSFEHPEDPVPFLSLP